MQMQGAVARAFRGGDDPASVLDETGLFEDLGRFMRAAGVPEDRVAEQLKRLEFSSGVATPATVPYSPTEERDPEADAFGSGAVVEVDPPPPLPGVSRYNINEEVPPVGAFVACVSSRSFRRLHKVGSCPMVPGVDYGNFDFLGMAMPKADTFDVHCKRCFGPVTPLASSSTASSGSSFEGSD
jgi:hypothetical protein